MPREYMPLQAADLSTFAKSLRQQLASHLDQTQALPGHLSLLNMLARAAGHRNLQSLRALAPAAAGVAPSAPSAPTPPPASAPSRAPLAAVRGHTPAPDASAKPLTRPQGPRPLLAKLPPARGPRDPAMSENADRALRQFDDQGRLMRWPSKYAVQRTALWGLWLHFDGKRRYTEREVNQVLNNHHLFGDHCTLRRELVNMKLLDRTPGGAEYRKLPARPEAEVVALLRRLRERAAG